MREKLTRFLIVMMLMWANVAGVGSLSASTLNEIHPLGTRGSKSAFATQQRGHQSVRLRESQPANAVSGMPKIYGSVIYNDLIGDKVAKQGLYELPKSEGPTTELFRGPNANAGGICIGNIFYATTTYTFMGTIYMEVEAYDITTGELIATYEPNSYTVLATGGIAQDPTTGQVYGITYTSDLTGYQLSKLNYTSTGVTSTLVAYLAGDWNALAFDANGQMYGISFTGDWFQYDDEDPFFRVTGSFLNKINKESGAVTLIGETGCSPQYYSSAVIDPATNRMFWNVCPSNNGGYMYEVNLQTGAAKYLYQLEYNDEIMGMFIAPPEASPNAPAACENVKVEFAGNSLIGKVSLNTPTKLYDGSTKGSGTLTAHVYANGVSVAEVTGQLWGKILEMPVDLTQSGADMYDFIVYVSNSNGDGPKTKVRNVWVGADTPEATTATLEYKNGYMIVNWLPVTGTVNGGFLDIANLTYTVKRADGTIASSGSNSTSFIEAVAAPEAQTEFYYTVEAVCNGMTSEAAVTNSIILGNIVPPYAFNFSKNGLNDWTIIDANKDEKTWLLDGNAVSCAYNTGKAMNDWLITPALVLKAGQTYDLKFDTYCFSKNHPERLEVKYGKEPTIAGQTLNLITPMIVDSEDPTAISVQIKPAEDALYYIGFHGMSDADKYRLYLSNIRIEAGVTEGAPKEVTDLKAEAAASGELKAVISFKTPTQSLNGTALTSLTKAEVIRGGNVVKTFDNPAPGRQLSFEDELQKGGNVSWTVVCYNEAGAGTRASVTTFVGCNLPKAPEKAYMTRTDVTGEVAISWTPVTEDIYGAILPAGAVKYAVCYYLIDSWVPVVENVSATSCTLQAQPDGEQDFMQYGICAVTTGGMGKVSVTPMIPVGTPYEGLEESFANGELHYAWGMESVLDGEADLVTDQTFSDVKSQDGDNGFLCIYGGPDGSGAILYSGLVNLANMTNPTYSFYVYNNKGENTDELYIEILPDGASQWRTLLSGTITSLCNNLDGWHKVSVPLSAYGNQVVQMRLGAITRDYQYKMIDNMRIGSYIEDNDMPKPLNLAGKQTADGVMLTWSEPDLSNSELQLAGYNVYRNGIRVNGAVVEDTKYVDKEVENGVAYRYTVTAVYTGKGESGFSNEVRVEISGIDELLNDQEEMVIYDITGRMIGEGRDDLLKISESGVYIVKSGNKTFKVRL